MYMYRSYNTSNSMFNVYVLKTGVLVVKYYGIDDIAIFVFGISLFATCLPYQG